jgi:hypothetical protein
MVVGMDNVEISGDGRLRRLCAIMAAYHNQRMLALISAHSGRMMLSMNAGAMSLRHCWLFSLSYVGRCGVAENY